MTQESTIQAIENLVKEILSDKEDIFLVSVKVKPINNIKVFLDADTGLSIEKCVKINREMYKVIEEKAWYPEGDFSLEVSSPGIEEPLKLTRQYKKNIGRKVELILTDDTKKEGRLLEVGDSGIKIEQTTGKNKKAITTISEIAFDNIKQTKVLIVF